MIHADFGGPDWLLCTIRMAQAAKRVQLYSYVRGLNMDQFYHSTTLPLVLALLPAGEGAARYSAGVIGAGVRLEKYA